MGKNILIGDFLHRIKRPIELESIKKYKLVTIKINHKGVVLRQEKLGSEIKSKMHEVKTGDFILSGIDARNGAFGIVPPELDGAVVTNDFWCFDIDEKVVEKHFFLELTSTKWFDEICRKGSDGTTQRIRLQKNKFFNQTISIPNIADQKSFISNFIRLKSDNSKLEAELKHQHGLIKKLRQQLLQEAIEGKHTAEWRAQNRDVEPASELLARIQAEKAQLIKDKKIKKQKPLPPITELEKPYALPDGWVWCRLGDVSDFISGNNFLSADFRKIEGIKSIKITNAGVGNIVETDEKLPYNFAEKYKHYLVFEGDIILALTRPYISDGLKVSRCPESYHRSLLNQRVAVIRTNNKILNQDYCYKFLKSDYVLFGYKAEFDTKGQQPNLKKEHVTHLCFPLPPLAEQQAIVAKVDKMLALCDQLENQISSNQSHAEQLMQAVLREAFTVTRD